jgi:putative flippase GtrA
MGAAPARSVACFTSRHCFKERAVVKFLRYLAVQIIAYGLDIGSFLLGFGLFGESPLISNAVAKVMAGTFAFVAHRNFTFDVASHSDRRRQAFAYFLLLTLNVPLSSGVLSLALRFITSPVAAKVVSDGICVLISYRLSKTLIFVRSREVRT